MLPKTGDAPVPAPCVESGQEKVDGSVAVLGQVAVPAPCCVLAFV